ncbi:chromosome segregation protein SMC [Oceanobacillus piezotolerans]|uniref:Chromosome partition protein Smc n=1 Tax=Oceanobacillus piezotolerans TaxID=2448030 RepID=A0A498D6D6_9BACI|nr:chromosome segregation protein SMC [Oceanobacillus piezotolerans]RLL45288.1 chromosome segregation protein SMC [Oceanobacillus piezotolerans]
MYLKRLESVGFKSFAERISVEFVPGVTAVVGPNGSGKSNITDAIRWVLGEQSAKSLRGAKMEDIIFQGSDTRKPLNVAEVTLVLNNENHTLPLDYDEVSVTRRVYRSGESEFYINKQSCRLKDIIDLFMDSGLGRDAFSIISQGKVEEILSSKAEERRTIFEEAAGVLKYKQRKKKAEYKLAETQENLNRVEDIIYEIEQQINPLKDQAETAKKYLQLKEELKTKEISFLIAEIEKIHTEWQLLLNTIENEHAEELKVKTAIQKKEAALEQKRQQVDEIDKEIERLQSSLLETTQLLEKYEGKKQLLNERNKHFDENKQKLESQKQSAAVKIGELHDELVKEQKQLSEITAKRQETKETVKQLQQKLSLNQETISEQIEELKSEYIEYLNKQAAMRNEKQSIETQLKQVLGKKDIQASKFEDLLNQREELNERRKLKKAKLVSQEAKYQDTQLRLKTLKYQLETERQVFQDSQTKLYQGYQYIEKLKSRKEMLDEMKEDFQGFFQGVKAVLKARENHKLADIYGAVIELIEVPKEYITAIETVLGGQAQHIVVKDDKAAREAILWLKKTNNGRATFLPLQSIQTRSIPREVLSQIENHSGYVGIAGQLVQANETYQRAVNHLMGNVIIAKTLKDANDIAKWTQRRFRVVTLDGDVVNPGGSMSGGAKKKTNQSLFTREKDLQEITEKINEYQEKIVQFEYKVKRKKEEISEIENELSLTEENSGTEQQQWQLLQTECKEIELKLESLNENLYIFDQDQKQYTQDREQLENRNKELSKELEGIRIQLEDINKQIEALSQQEVAFKENKETLQQELHQSQVALAELEERVRNQREKVKTVEERLKAFEEQYDMYTDELDKLLEMEHVEETEEEIDSIIISKKEIKLELTTSIQEKRQKRAHLTAYTQDEEREIKEETKKHQSFLNEIQQKEVQANRLDVDLENRLSLLETEYMITYEKASKTYEKAENIAEAKEEVKALKLAIESLGNVNLGAIDEYERVSERYSFLSEQRNDLVEAKNTLFAVIAEMDDEMEKRFDSTFTQIKDQFGVVFRQLFGGGHAELKLTDPKNLLDTGVDIIAQPPGKKLQNLGLLSGGERALTAIALLFAILRVRPVPFCILDEVEAALDEANVSRFAKYVKLYSENTQFIVITHRKGTMEEADVLYGVTMQESGVSRMVSVRLEDTKELINS